MEKLEGITNGDQYLKILRPSFHIWIRMKNIFKEMVPVTYERHFEVDLALQNLKDNIIVMGKYWQLIVRYHKIYLPYQYKYYQYSIGSCYHHQNIEQNPTPPQQYTYEQPA